MILKRVYEEYNFNIEGLLIKESKRLKLTTNELSVLLVLFNNAPKRRIFSLNSLARKIDFSANELAEIVGSLLSKEFLNITLEVNNGKEREVYDLDGTFSKIEDLFKSDHEEKLKDQSFNSVSETIKILEDKFGRMLRSNELDRIRTWFDVYEFSSEHILDVVSNLDKEVSIIYIERILNASTAQSIKIDESTNQLLDDIYKKL